MIEAERSFILMAKEVNTRDAFLRYLSDSVITFDTGEPKRGKDRIKSRPANKGWLNWDIAHSDISASGDIGFNSGPYEYRVNRADSSAVSFGEFNSVWKEAQMVNGKIYWT